ncbi:hypothetical protein [Methanobrevibacter ruminantium]|uniref:hypothetical protein n=1 Tax=Methanobrevibacter ruminantium TaxID=83816 RepID=UPI0026EDF293|nr:hypothetical protein [Methanobrevibacter ruminantium]
MANKVEIEIDVDVNNEESINKLKNQLDDLEDSAEDVTVDVETKKAKQRLEELLQIKKQMQEEGTWGVNVESSQVGREIAQLKKQLGEVDDEPIKPKFDDSSAQLGIQNIKEGFQSLKQGASEVGQVLTDALESAGKQETNFQFLKGALNNDEALAQEKMNDIKKIVQRLPGDDTAVQGLLSQAIAKDADLTKDSLADIGTAYADYASAMSFYGKSGIEAQQDMTNYILAGNTAELERSPILSSHIDKLKEANTIQERSEALQEALNEEHWGGMSQQDTYNNKLETFNGMLERGKYTLGGMFQEGAKSAMDLALKLDDATGGLLGMGLAAVSFASPLSDMVVGAGQAAMGIKSLRDVYKDLTVMETIANAIEGEGAIAHIASALGITTEAAAADGAAVSFGGLAIAEGAALWPILAIIGALALFGVAVYEVGKYFGWWTDVGSMIDAISAGLQRLWSAFINNPDVQSFIQGIKDAWNGVVAALGPVISQVMSFFGISQGGEFDIVRALILGIGAAWRNIKPAIMLIIQAITFFVGYVSNGIARAKQIIQTLQAKWTAVKNAISGAASDIKNALTSPFQQAWGVVKPIYDKFETAINWGKQLIGWSGVEYAGFSTDNVGYAGFGSEDTLNSTLSSIANNSTNNSNITNNFNINGIIEEEASQFIVSSVNDHIKKQNLIRGV